MTWGAVNDERLLFLGDYPFNCCPTGCCCHGDTSVLTTLWRLKQAAVFWFWYVAKSFSSADWRFNSFEWCSTRHAADFSVCAFYDLTLIISRSWRATSAFFDLLAFLIFKRLSPREPRRHPHALTRLLSYTRGAVLNSCAVTLYAACMLRKLVLLVSPPQTFNFSMTKAWLPHFCARFSSGVEKQSRISFPIVDLCDGILWFLPRSGSRILQFHFTCVRMNRLSRGRLFQILHRGGDVISLLITRCSCVSKQK